MRDALQKTAAYSLLGLVSLGTAYIGHAAQLDQGKRVEALAQQEGRTVVDFLKADLPLIGNDIMERGPASYRVFSEEDMEFNDVIAVTGELASTALLLGLYRKEQ